MSSTSLVRSVSTLAVLATMLFVPAKGAADPIKFMRDPHVANGMIVFSYHGDIWIARQDGTEPRRLTYHVAREIAPRFSPDGRWVAFASNRFGNNDVFLVPVAGGEPMQLTFHSGNDVVAGWTPNGEAIIFGTSRGTHPFYSPMYTVPATGGIPMPMEMDQARNVMINQDGTMVAFNRNPLSTSRKGQKGNRTTNIFLQDVATKEITQLTDTDIQGFRDHTHDAIPMWGADGMVYFVSARGGIFNIWKISPDGGAPTEVTRHAQGGVKYPSISPDGRTIIYTNDHELWTLDVPNGRPQALTVDLSFDPTTNLIEWVHADNRSDGMSPSPDGNFLAVDFRGEVFLVPVDADVGEKTRITRSPWRERYASYSPDGSHLAYVSDEGLEEELWVYDLGDGSRTKLSAHESQKTGNYTWSPEGDRIAYVAANRLFEVDVESGRTTELAYNQERGTTWHSIPPTGTGFSTTGATLTSAGKFMSWRSRAARSTTSRSTRSGTGLGD